MAAAFSPLFAHDDFQQSRLDTLAHLHRLLRPRLAATLGQPFPQLDGRQLPHSKFWRGRDDLKERRHGIRVLQVAVLERLCRLPDHGRVGHIGLLQQLVQVLHKFGLQGR